MEGILNKMQTSLSPAGVAQYALPLGEQTLPLNDLIGKPLHLAYSGRIFCVACGRKTSKSFNQGYCFPCFKRLARCDICIVKPELCHFAQGTCREPEWALQFCFQPHIVYLANTSGLKVGITRQTQIPTRWIDQGATQALPVFRVKSRRAAGLLEVALAQQIPDKTQWRTLLRGDGAPLDLQAAKAEVMAQCEQVLASVVLPEEDGVAERYEDAPEFSCKYPVLRYPEKIATLDFEKTATLGGTLEGIKGQYLIFDTGVINMRKFGGYEIAVGD
ncbi:Hypothetical protein HDN1F_09130 [gamma proteobacterium HdN1]|nr:Hypothetical protein HDN1F_09130 [gamma proteobacterium HdN1]